MALDLEAFRAAIYKRGFRQTDPLRHPCPKCNKQRAVEKWSLAGRTGGRDIDICMECSDVKSWRRRPHPEDREEDKTFDPVTFMK